MIGIINLGIGNIVSVKNMLAKIGYKSFVAEIGTDLKKCEKIILPGVGSFDHAVDSLNLNKFLPLLNDLVLKEKLPILGICLGMQLMTNRSEEGKLKGLGWIEGEVVKFRSNNIDGYKVPHMGWNYVKIIKNILMNNDEKFKNRFYFVHSYHVSLSEENYCIAKTNYGNSFTSAFNKENIYGVQFHPEKSHNYGMKLLKKFCEI